VDCRHKKDYLWFKEHYSDRIKRIRITADESIRVQRGWKFTAGVDDGPSECDLDDVDDWDLVVTNNGTENDNVRQALDTVSKWLQHPL